MFSLQFFFYRNTPIQIKSAFKIRAFINKDHKLTFFKVFFDCERIPLVVLLQSGSVASQWGVGALNYGPKNPLEDQFYTNHPNQPLV